MQRSASWSRTLSGSGDLDKDMRCSPSLCSCLFAAAASHQEHVEAGWYVSPVSNHLVLVLVVLLVPSISPTTPSLLDRLLELMIALANNSPGRSGMSSCSSCLKQLLQELPRASMAPLQMQLKLLSCRFHVTCADHFEEIALHSASQHVQTDNGSRRQQDALCQVRGVHAGSICCEGQRLLT